MFSPPRFDDWHGQYHLSDCLALLANCTCVHLVTRAGKLVVVCMPLNSSWTAPASVSAGSRPFVYSSFHLRLPFPPPQHRRLIGAGPAARWTLPAAPWHPAALTQTFTTRFSFFPTGCSATAKSSLPPMQEVARTSVFCARRQRMFGLEKQLPSGYGPPPSMWKADCCIVILVSLT